MKRENRRRSGAWRLASAFASLGLLAWGLAAVAYVNTSGASAEASPQFRSVDTHLLVPHNGEWYNVAIEMLMFDAGETFEQDAETARAEMLSRFPGAVEMSDTDHGETAQNVGGLASERSAFVLSGFKWMANSANWGYDGTGAPSGVSAGAMSAMQAAASTWGQQGVTFQFTGGAPSSAGTGACGGGGTNGSNTVGWSTQSGSVLAVTCSWFGTQGTPRPAIEFDMQFDPGWSWTTGGTTGVDLQSVALHEFGHAAGLNHSASASAVMFASYTSGTIKRTPTSDDIAGLGAIYSTAGGNPTNTPANTPTNTPQATNTPGNPNPSPTIALPTSTPTKTPTQPPAGGGGSTATPVPPTNTPTRTPTNPPGATATPTNSPTPTATATRTATATPSPGNSLPILPGANLMAWPGGDLPPAEALANVPNLRIVYAYDSATGNWTRFVPGAPSFINNLPLLKKGGSYWFIATGSAQVPFQP